jgi:basic amino acid/polyamine antiporter, APA family
MIIVLIEGILSVIAGVTVFCVLIVDIIMNIAIIRLRYKKSKVDRQFTSPFSIKEFPILPGLGIGLSIIILFQFEPRIILNGVICIVGIILFVYLSKIIRWLIDARS